MPLEQRMLRIFPVESSEHALALVNRQVKVYVGSCPATEVEGIIGVPLIRAGDHISLGVWTKEK